MNYFTIMLMFIFLVITLYLQLFKYFINNPDYWEGLRVVPILLGANIFLVFTPAYLFGINYRIKQFMALIFLDLGL